MDIVEIFQLLAAGHVGLSARDYLWNAIFGAIGATTAYLADKEGVVLLTVRIERGRRARKKKSAPASG